MKSIVTILIVSVFTYIQVFAGTPAAPIDPVQYLGKSLDECEKSLGKPNDVRTISKENTVRRYVSKSAHFDYIELMCDGARFGMGALPPNTVTSVSFGLKKEPECSSFKCRTEPKHKLTSLGELYGFFGFNDIDKIAASPLPAASSTIIHPSFGYLTPDGGALSGFRLMIRSEQGNVQSEYWSIQWLKSEDSNMIESSEKMKTQPGRAVETESIQAYVKSRQPRENAEVRFYLTQPPSKP
jgi:hypothetical protein